MASLVSPGVSVTITNESFFIPAGAATIPLIILATADEKTQPDGITAAAGTYESNTVRTVTSLTQSTQLFGIPSFLVDSSGQPQHGDARNEYGLFALNQFLGIGSLAYVVRANVNLNDNFTAVQTMWSTSMSQAAYILENLASSYINNYNLAGGYIPSQQSDVITVTGLTGGTLYTPGVYNNISLTGGTGTGAKANITVDVSASVVTAVISNGGIGYTPGDILSASSLNIGGTGSGFTITVATVTPNSYKTTLTGAELLTLATTATQAVFHMYSFRNSSVDFLSNSTASPIPVYSNGFSSAPVGTGFLGLAGIIDNWTTNLLGSTPPYTGWTPTEAGNTLLGAADSFKFTHNFLNQTSLGANDAARRVAIVAALRAIVNANTDIRSEVYEYNLILCPGFPELAQALNNLSLDIQEEALVIADTPFDATPDSVVTWGATTARTTSSNTTYYYPHGLSSNLDGATVYVSASGTALHTIAYSDSVSEVWMAPAGTRRGVVSSLIDVGYVTGTLGTVTQFVPSALNLGQRNNLYKYFTNINPIVFFPGRGIIIWGQKTSAPDASALDRINVVRLMMYIKRALRKNTMSFVFEPNDKLTQDNLKAMVDGFLTNLIVKRGLYDYATVCDGTNNTPTRVDNNELYIDIALKPVKAAEFIYIPIRIVATGAPLARG